MKRNRALMFILAAAASVLITGCTGTEPNEIAYVVALGIDSAENGSYKVTIQYANPTKISGGGDEKSGGTSGGGMVENLVVEAPNIYSAIGLANQIDSKTFSLSHTKLVVFSREIAEKGLKNLTGLFIRSEELRPDVYLAVGIEGAEQYLEAINPVMEINPAKYYQLIFDKNKITGLPHGIEKNFFFGIETGDYDSLLPIAGIAQTEDGSSDNTDSSGGGKDSENIPKTNEKQQNAPMNETPFEYKMRNYTAGENAIALTNRSEAMGSAIFRKDKMVGILGSIDTELYKLLDNDYTHSYLTLYNENTPDYPITVKTVQRKAPKYDIDIQNKTINVKLFLDGDIYSVPSDYNIDSDLEGFENKSAEYVAAACGEFMTRVTEEYESDIFRLNERCKKKFLTNEAYEKYKETADYKNFDIEVEVDFEIKRTGLIIRE